MKKITQSIGLFLLLVSYGLILSGVFTSLSQSKIYVPFQSEKNNYFAPVSSDLFCTTNTSENTVSNVNQTFSLSYDNPPNYYGVCANVKDQLIKSEFTQIVYQTKNLLLFTSKLELIFPFHYFW